MGNSPVAIQERAPCPYPTFAFHAYPDFLRNHVQFIYHDAGIRAGVPPEPNAQLMQDNLPVLRGDDGSNRHPIDEP